MSVKPIPEGYHTVTPYLVVSGVAQLIDFLKEAFAAEETVRMAQPDGTVNHAEMRIGDSLVMMGEASEEHEAIPAMLHLYVEDVDRVFRRAVKAGGTVLSEPADKFYGDRMGGVKDASGNQWWIATHIEDVSPEEIGRRQEALAE
jgi:PhnB protein